MNKPFDYIAEANLTASNNFHGNLIPIGYLHTVVTNCIESLNRLDAIKKSLFYGRHTGEIEAVAAGTPENAFRVDCRELPLVMDPDNPARGELLIHSIIGKATECGEQLELLADVLFKGVKFDEVNFIEEIGDGFWYDAIGLSQVNATFDEVQRTNIAKLRHRFPNKFTEYDANNRDLFGERQILETGGCAPPVVAVLNTGHNPTPREKPHFNLENWTIAGGRLIGNVIHAGGTQELNVLTSRIISMDTENNVAETLNSFYHLGKPEVDFASSELQSKLVDNG